MRVYSMQIGRNYYGQNHSRLALCPYICLQIFRQASKLFSIALARSSVTAARSMTRLTNSLIFEKKNYLYTNYRYI